MVATSRPSSGLAILFVTLLIGLLLPAPAIAADQSSVYTLQADGLACPFCAYGIEKQLNRIEGVGSVETDIKAGTVVITMEPGATLDEAEARRAVDAAGFTMRAFKEKDADS